MTNKDDISDLTDDLYLDALADLAKKVEVSARCARNRTECRYIPENHEESHRAGEKVEIAALQITYVQENGVEASYQARIDKDLRWMGTPPQWQELRDELKWIRNWFKRFVGNDPTELNEPITHMFNASKAIWDSGLNRAQNDKAYRDANGPIEGWGSLAGHAFRTNFWTPAPEIVQNQAFFAALLGYALTALQEALVEHRRSLRSIAKQAIKALDALQMDTGGGFSVNLSVVAAVATVVAGTLTLPIGGGAVAAAGAGAATIIAGASALPSENKPEPKKNEMSADTVDGVLQNMRKATYEANSDLEHQELRIMLMIREYHVRLRDPGTELTDKHILLKPSMVDRADKLADDPRVTIPE